MKYEDIQTVIFDFDGTLADTLPLCYHSFQTVFKTFDDKDLTDEQVKAMFGPAEPDIIKRNLESDDIEAAIELYFNTYSEEHDKFVRFNENINSMLIALKEEGLKLAIVTGKSQRSLDISLKQLEMEKQFDYKISGDDVSEPKPDPEGIFKVLSHFDQEKHHAIFLGDSDADVQAGLRAEMLTIGVQWLPNIQTSQFSDQPDVIYGKVDQFMKDFSL